MLSIFEKYFKKQEPIEQVKIITRDFDINEFNDWFKTEFDGYDGRKGAAGIFLRTDKLSPHWIGMYLTHIGQDASFDNCYMYYDVVRKDWIDKLSK